MYRLIAAEELGKRLEEGEELALVDLRDEAAFRAGHLPGAVLVPAGVSVERWVPQRFSTGSLVVLYDDDWTVKSAGYVLPRGNTSGLVILGKDASPEAKAQQLATKLRNAERRLEQMKRLEAALAAR